MARSLTADAFQKLLQRLDPDENRAGERYEELRRTLIRFFEWRNAPFPEDHADETLDRVASKLDAAVDIRHLDGYCYEVARLVFLESLKGHDSKLRSLSGDLVDRSAADTSVEDEWQEARLACLDRCLGTLSPESRDLILNYHREGTSRVRWRRTLAVRLGLQRDALANRAQRVRNRLEACVTSCLDSKHAI